ncbi:MAG: TetR/AcrR family transcriptional regulator [Burkholderiales bacterium]|nr:TetR/AcrR family transcriptional regulator [Burkholderiales bacterium]
MHAPAASPWTSPQDRARDRADKREAVLRTAARLFSEKGFHATSLDEVAERLSVTKPTLYYYVKNKDEILFGCVHAGLEMVRAGIAQATESGGSALERLRACMRAYAAVVMSDFGMCVIRVGEDPLPADNRRKLRALKAQIDLEFRQLIEAGIADGSVAPCDAKIAAFTLAGAISWIGRWYQPGGELGPEEVAESCIQLLLQGIVPRAPVARRSVARIRGRKA